MIGMASDRFGRLETAGVVTFTCGLLCFALWIPAKTYAPAIVFAILSGGMLGVFWMVSRESIEIEAPPGLRLTCTQTVGPIAVEVAGLAELPSLLSLSWLSTVLPTTCRVYDDAFWLPQADTH